MAIVPKKDEPKGKGQSGGDQYGRNQGGGGFNPFSALGPLLTKGIGGGGGGGGGVGPVPVGGGGGGFRLRRLLSGAPPASGGAPTSTQGNFDASREELFRDFQRRLSAAKTGQVNANTSLQGYLANLGARTSSNLYAAADPALLTGLTTLQQLLNRQGQIDPAARNRELADIGLTTQAAQTDIQGTGARLGLQNSGVLQAVAAARGQAGAEQRADTIARFNREAEDRMRQDLGILRDMIISPAFQGTGQALGVPSTPKQDNTAAYLTAAAAIFAAFA